MRHLTSRSLLRPHPHPPTRSPAQAQVVLSAERPPGAANWLRLAPDATRLVMRQTFLRREAEEAAEVRLERLAVAGEERPMLSAQQVR